MPSLGWWTTGAAAGIVVLAMLASIPASRGGNDPWQIGPPGAAADHSDFDRGPPSTNLLELTAAEAAHAQDNDYPTATRADYVIGCMAANGNTHEALLKCSCAIDTIAGLMPYSHYEQAETALSLQRGGGVGGRVGLFRDPPQIKAVIEELRRAQAEANLQCH